MGKSLRRKVTIIGVMSLIAVVTGPFSTFDTMSLGARAVYWPISLAAISLAVICVIRVVRMLPGISSQHALVGIALGAFVAGPFGSVALLSVDYFLLDKSFAVDRILRRWPPITTIAFFIAATEYYLLPQLIAKLRASSARAEESGVPHHEEVSTTTAGSTDAEPLFWRHLDGQPGSKLLSISTNDHYLDVVTDIGRERILKRMSDAIVELNGYPGLQIHRSHWVALDAIDGIERDGRKHLVRLVNGDVLPVSRPNVSQLLEALNKDADRPT